MAQSRTPKTPQPAPIDDIEDRMGSMEELSFPDDELSGRIGDARPEADVQNEFSAKRIREAGLTGASVADHQPTADDLSPETLYDESGARSPHEKGRGGPSDKKLRIVDEDEIGGGTGLDEAELARDDPLDSARYRQTGATKPSGKK